MIDEEAEFAEEGSLSEDGMLFKIFRHFLAS